MEPTPTPSLSSNDRVLIAFGCVALLLLTFLALRSRPVTVAQAPHASAGDPPTRAAAPHAEAPPSPPVDVQALMAQGEELYHACMMCHGMSGGGLPGQFPPLKGSELVMGPESRLARILLHGLEGPVVVNGTTYDMPMAPAPVNEDQEIAALMTFIRRSFGNNAEPVATQTITRIREATKDRQSSWTIEELKAIP